jgi:hypothetical protein
MMITLSLVFLVAAGVQKRGSRQQRFIDLAQ